MKIGKKECCSKGKEKHKKKKKKIKRNEKNNLINNRSVICSHNELDIFLFLEAYRPLSVMKRCLLFHPMNTRLPKTILKAFRVGGIVAHTRTRARIRIGRWGSAIGPTATNQVLHLPRRRFLNARRKSMLKMV